MAGAVAVAAGGRVAVAVIGLAVAACVAVALTGAAVLAALLQAVRMNAAANAIPVNL
jgi:hypothetical protein